MESSSENELWRQGVGRKPLLAVEHRDRLFGPHPQGRSTAQTPSVPGLL